MTEPSDLDLVRAVAAGDRRAFEALYARHAPTVMRFLHHLCHDAGLAEDLTQETFVRAWRAAPRFRPEAAVRTWLLEIAKRRGWSAGARGARRRSVWGTPMAFGETALASRGDLPADAVERADTARSIRRALLALSPKLRLAFVLVRLEGCSFAEAAEIAGVPVGTVKSRTAAAEARLRERLGPSAIEEPR